MKIKANGIMMSYDLVGSGQSLTLIHGAADNSQVWYKQVPVFSQHNQVLTYDMRGYGETEVTEEELSNKLWVEDLHALLNALGISRTILLGTSRGGGIAAEFTLAYPEMVRALILSSSSVSAALRKHPISQLQAGNQAALAAIEKGKGRDTSSIASIMFTKSFQRRDPETVARFKAIVMSNDPQRYRKVMQRKVPSATPDLSQISRPTLIIGGYYDADIGKETFELLHKTIPGSKLKMLRTGHIAALEKPEEHNRAVLEFIAEIRTG